MTALRDIEESIRYSCRKMPDYGESLIKRIQTSFETQKQVDKIIEMIDIELPQLYQSSERLANMGTQMAIASSMSTSARIEIYESILKMLGKQPKTEIEK